MLPIVTTITGCKFNNDNIKMQDNPSDIFYIFKQAGRLSILPVTHIINSGLNWLLNNFHQQLFVLNFASVFHRILDFKAGLDFYPGPFFYYPTSKKLLYLNISEFNVMVHQFKKMYENINL